MSEIIKVLVWDENKQSVPSDIYPANIRGAIVAFLNQGGGGAVEATAASLDDPDQGITAERLAETDVLIWWGHARHAEVADEAAELVWKAVCERGMGFMPLHSAHYSKPFQRVLNCTGHLKGGWREQEDPADREELRVAAPKHPICAGIDDFVIEREEMYGAPFDVPPFETLILQSYFPLGGEYFPSFATTAGAGIDPAFGSGGGKGANQGKGKGRVFYFRPGHETFPTYHVPEVQKVILNGVKWLAKRT